MPSPVKVRFTVDYETIHFFSKNQKYRFNQQFESYAPASEVRYRQALRANRSYNTKKPYEKNTPYSGKYKRGQGAVSSRGDDADGLVVGGNSLKGRNKRCVWSIPTQPSSISHFALFPLEIPRICILAGSDHGDIILDPFAGAMTTLLAAKQLNRQAVGIELNESYIKSGIKRLGQEYLPF
jgi:DNA modification methylase